MNFRTEGIRTPLYAIAIAAIAAVALSALLLSCDTASGLFDYDDDDYYNTDTSFKVGDFVYYVMITTDDEVMLSEYTGKDTELVIPDSVQRPSDSKTFYVTYVDWGFADMSGDYNTIAHKITSIKFPDKMDILTGDPTAYKKLRSVEIGSAYVGAEFLTALDTISTLEEVKISEGNTAYSSVDGVVYSKDKKLLQLYPQGRSSSVLSIPKETIAIEDPTLCYNKNIESIQLEAGSTSLIVKDGVLYDYELTAVWLYPRGYDQEKYTMPLTVTKAWYPIVSDHLKEVILSPVFADEDFELGFEVGGVFFPQGSIKSLLDTTEAVSISLVKAEDVPDVVADATDNTIYQLKVGDCVSFDKPITMKLYHIRHLANNMHVLRIDPDGNVTELDVKRDRSGAEFETDAPGYFTHRFNNQSTIENAETIALVIAGVGTLLAIIAIIKNVRRDE